MNGGYRGPGLELEDAPALDEGLLELPQREQDVREPVMAGSITRFELDGPRIVLMTENTVDGVRERLDLTSKEFALLSLLLRRRGEVQSRTSIAEQVEG